MPNRPFECEACHRVFRTDSGRAWHMSHRHSIPEAVSALKKQHSAETANLLEYNAALTQKVKQLHTDLDNSRFECLEQTAASIQNMVEIKQLNETLWLATVGIAGRNLVLKEKLNIVLPSPFLEKPPGA